MYGSHQNFNPILRNLALETTAISEDITPVEVEFQSYT